MDIGTEKWMLSLPDEKLVDVLFSAGRIPWQERDYWLDLMPKLRASRPEARQGAFGVALNKHDEPLRELCFNYRNCATEDAEETFQRIVRFVTA